MPRSTIVIDNAILKLGPTATAVDFSCQVNSAALTPTPNSVDVPATFCVGKSTTAAPSSFALDLTYLQDWGDAASVSQYLYDNDGQQGVDFEMSGIATTGNTVTVTGVCTIVAGDYGGEAGTPLQATVSLPCDGKPTITATAGLAARSGDSGGESDDVNVFQPA